MTMRPPWPWGCTFTRVPKASDKRISTSAQTGSGTAVGRATAAAARRGVLDGRIDWRIEDLSDWQPTGSYDLV
ncbi:MAG: hypothetical protein LOD91_00830, partial [Limnochordales bacterium]